MKTRQKKISYKNHPGRKINDILNMKNIPDFQKEEYL